MNVLLAVISDESLTRFLVEFSSDSGVADVHFFPIGGYIDE